MRKKKAHITFKATIPGLEMAWPVEPISQQTPPRGKKGNMNVCPGILDYNAMGYMIRAWSEIHINQDSGNFQAHVNDREHDITKGECGRLNSDLVPWEYGEVCEPNVLKIELPWLIETPPGYSCIQTSPFYHGFDLEPAVMTYPGIVDTDGLHRLSWVFSVRHHESFIIPRGTPLLQIIPFRREPYESTVSRAELGDWMNQKLKMSTLIKKWYMHKFHRKKVYR